MFDTNRALELSGLSTAATIFLLIRAALAVVIISIGRKASVSKTTARSPRAYITCGLWTIRVSRRRRSGSGRRPKLTSAVEAASTSMAGRIPRAASSSDVMPDGFWLP